MSSDTELPVARLRQRLVGVISNGTISGAAVLRDLAKLSRECLGTDNPDKKVVAFVVASVLQSLSDAQYGQAVAASDHTILMRELQQPLLRAIDFLRSAGDSGEAVRVASDLVRGWELIRQQGP